MKSLMSYLKRTHGIVDILDDVEFMCHCQNLIIVIVIIFNIIVIIIIIIIIIICAPLSKPYSWQSGLPRQHTPVDL